MLREVTPIKHTLAKLFKSMPNMSNRSATSLDFSYDVFLGYFNGGTSKAFVDRLNGALLAKAISTFRDGETRPAIEGIQKSRVPILVLCENYASSPACLDELAKIAEYVDNKAKQVTVIFYKVEPTVIRKQKESYAEAMNEHEKREGEDSKKKVQTWREALKRVCDLSGIHFKDNMDESELIEKIVKDTFTKLAPVPFQIPHVVGLDAHFECVMSVLDIESKDTVGMLGIYGSGGIGKTTFAAYLYDNIRHKFEAATFLIHDRERTNRSIVEGLDDLQKTLLSQMGEEAKTLVGSTLDRCNEIKLRLRKSRVLLVLDDVDNKVILKSLAGGCDWFGPGSRIIITTRDAAVLDNHDVEIKKYKLEELNDHDSLELFCSKAFGMSRPAENFENMSSRAVSYAKGIPLALRVIGSNLKDRSIEEWEIELGKYRKVPDAEIQRVLEISYDSLSELDQRIFLDIACFFIREKWIYVQRILEACDFSPSFRVFDSKCLISIDENGCLEMHDLIRDMGREIVRKKSPSNPGERSRLWSCEDILQVLQENSGGSKIEGIMLHPPIHEEIDHWTNTSFEKMSNLRILIVRNATFSTGPSYLPNSLRLLDWMGFPSKSLPTDFHPERIVDFKLSYSSLIFAEPLQAFKDLIFMNISQCQSITHIPNLSGAKSLRALTLDRCYKLEGFDKSFGLYMTNLVYLSASECTMLKSFVPTMYFPSLEVLSFNFCTSLESFPDVKRKMDKLLKIHLKNTSIKEFPNSIPKLTGLEYVDLSNCEGVRDLSRSFLLLPKLVTLKVDGCSQLGQSFKKFKESLSVGNPCSSLKALYFSKANLSYEDLYTILEIFPKLEFLNVPHNAFVSLPECIKGSLLLKSLDISFCRNLVEIPELPLTVQNVDARYCQSLSTTASSVLWSQVFKETERIQVVMPKTEIPNWFDCVGSEDILVFWARHKFPIIALAFGLHEIQMDSSAFFPGIISANQSHNVGLYLFIDGQEICHKDYNVGKNHVLVCELRALFNDEEWKGLDARLGDDWKPVQVQCKSNLILNRWGVYVYKRKTNADDIRFSFPDSIDNVPSSCLVPKPTPDQKIKQGLDFVEIFGQYLNTLKLEQSAYVANELLRWWRNSKGDVKEEVSSSTYGASLMQEHEQCLWDLAHILEMMENVAKHITDSKVQSAGQLVIQLLMARAQPMKEKGHETLHINTSIPVILEECEYHPCTDLAEAPRRRYWGSVELEEGDPFVWRIWKSKESFQERVSIVLSKYQHTSTEGASSSCHGGSLEEENKYPPALEELTRRIEQDAMRLNKSYGKLKAYFVPIDVPVSDKYNLETAIIRGQERLGRLGSNFNKTPYGKLRVAHDDALDTVHMQPELRVEHDDALGTVHMQPELRVDHDAQNTSQSQKQYELGVKHVAQSQSTVQNQSKKGWTKILNWWIR